MFNWPQGMLFVITVVRIIRVIKSILRFIRLLGLFGLLEFFGIGRDIQLVLKYARDFGLLEISVMGLLGLLGSL